MLRNSPLPLGPNHLPNLVRLRDTQLLLLSKLSNVRSKQKEISQLIKSGLGDKDELVRQAKKLKTRIGEYETNLSATEEELLELGLVLPNWTSEGVPIGPEENAVEVERFGPEVKREDQVVKRDHLDVANHFDLLDNEASTISTGASWPYLRGTLALLEMALVNYATSVCLKHGYEPVLPPDVIRTDIASRCGFNPRDGVDGDSAPSQTYHIANTDLCLAGTAEIPLSALFANRILDQKSIPRKVVGIGHAFRAEAGARGADTRGLYRVHQFTKVEMFCVTSADRGVSEGMMEDMRSVQKEIAEGLSLSVRYVASALSPRSIVTYDETNLDRVLDMPTEELGASAARKYDMEAWMPGRGKWGEVSSSTLSHS
jgi:seryl-tRNA synthetase